CSEQEAFGRTIIESMAAGVPVVAAGRTGSKEAVTHGVDGLLYDPAVDGDLVEKLCAVEADAALRERLIAGGRARAREFSVAAHVRRVEEVYEALVR
ncbi:MAG: glycosyltransferase, partial [Bryobacteraceae bacterium]